MLIHSLNLKRVAYGDGEEDSLQVVVAVWTALHYIKSEVDFGAREDYHIMLDF